MEYRFLGKSGIKVSAISYGSYVTFSGQFEEDTAYDCMVAAYDEGVNFFDNAEAYADDKAELMMGKILKKPDGNVPIWFFQQKYFGADLV